MAIKKYTEIIPDRFSANGERRVIYTSNLLTAIVDFSEGPESEPQPFHSHPHEQTCYVASGEILFFMEEEEPVHLKEGDLFAVPAGKQHTIQLLTEKVRLIDSFNPVREDFI